MMEGKVIAAVGSCAILAGVAYIFQGEDESKKANDRQPKLFPGLVNLGNTCYLNSVVQALASVTTFVVWLKTSCGDNITNKRLMSELLKLMQVLNKPCDEQDSYNPSLIFSTLCSHGWIVTREQQDAHEIFQVITSTLADEEEFIHTSKKTWNHLLSEKTSVSEAPNDSIVHRSRVRASKVERKTFLPFTGLFANQLSCKACLKKHSVKFEYFDTISLSLPNKISTCSLQGLLRKFVCSEIIESFKCESCDKNKLTQQKRLLKKISLGKLPHCLCFHINRTYWQNNGIPFKNNTFVKFPEMFDISPFLYTSCDIGTNINVPIHFPTSTLVHLDDQPQNKIDGKDDKKETVNTRLLTNTGYDLVAVIVHIGGVNEGHYVTYRKLDELKHNKWAFVSDETVQIVPLSKVLSSDAYMLFYERATK